MPASAYSTATTGLRGVPAFKEHQILITVDSQHSCLRLRSLEYTVVVLYINSRVHQLRLQKTVYCNITHVLCRTSKENPSF